MSNPPVASVKGTLLKLTLFRLTDKKNQIYWLEQLVTNGSYKRSAVAYFK